MPGTRGVRGARAGGARAVRRVGRTDRGRARGAHGTGPQPTGLGGGTGAPPRTRRTVLPSGATARVHAEHRCRAAVRTSPRQPTGTFAACEYAEHAPIPSTSVRSGTPPGRQRAAASARSRPASRSSVAATAGTCGQVGQGQRDDLALAPRAPPSRCARPLGRTDSIASSGRTATPRPGADQADHRRVVVGGEVDARGEAGTARRPRPAGRGSAGSPRSTTRRRARRSPTATPAPASRCPSGTSADQPVGEQRAYDQVVPLLGAAARPRSGRPARCRSRPPAASRPSAAARPPPGRPGCPGWAARSAARARGHQRGAAAGEGDQPDPAGPQPGDRGDLLLGGGEPGEDAGGVPDQRLARLGQPHLAAAADEQRGARGGLQRLHLLADGGLGAAQLARRRGEGAGGGHGAQHTEMTGFDHPSTISAFLDRHGE